MAIIRPTGLWDPFDSWNTPGDFMDVSRTFRRMQRELDRAMDTFAEPFVATGALTRAEQANTPLVDLTETDKEYRMTVELPGLGKDKVKVETRENRIVLSGELQPESLKGGEGSEGVRTHFRERRAGKFARELTVPKNADLQNIQASMEHGVLSLTIPKVEPAKAGTRVITIS